MSIEQNTNETESGGSVLNDELDLMPEEERKILYIKTKAEVDRMRFDLDRKQSLLNDLIEISEKINTKEHEIKSLKIRQLSLIKEAKRISNAELRRTDNKL